MALYRTRVTAIRVITGVQPLHARLSSQPLGGKNSGIARLTSGFRGPGGRGFEARP